jgi:hypothetical protein
MKHKVDTVGDLIEHLQKWDKTLPFGRTGHYGEFYPMEVSDFRPSHAYEHEFGFGKLKPYFEILAIDVPDIGPEPD